PNNYTIDIVSDVIFAMCTYQQLGKENSESGGLLLGYVDSRTSCETISALTTPQPDDLQSRFSYSIRDGRHYDTLSKSVLEKNYFMVTWHTQPQKYPSPSSTDWLDWKNTLIWEPDPKYRYAYYIILGTERMRVWSGDFSTRCITELLE